MADKSDPEDTKDGNLRPGSEQATDKAAVDAGVPSKLAVECLIHELRQPLLGLRASLGFMVRELGDRIEDLEEWPVVWAQITRLEELFTSYRELVDPEPPELSTFDAAVVAEQAIELLWHRLEPLGDGFQKQIDDDLWPVFGSPNALLHALVNILKNALEALLMRPETGRVVMRLFNSQTGGIEVRVSNDGSRAPDEPQHRLFEPRVTTKKKAGSGLGLYIARLMLSRSGSSVDFAGDDDPRRLDWAVTELVIHLPRPPVHRRTSSEGRRALIVDDEPVILSMLEMVLREIDFEVVATTMAEEAESLLNHEHFDLLITDKNLQELGGVELAATARQADPNMAILLITGYPSAESADQLMRLDADAYVRKPFEIQELTDAVEGALARREKQTLLSAGGKRELFGLRASLVVQCEAVERRILVATLEHLGYECRYYGNLKEALHEDPDAGLVVVSDAFFDRDSRALLVERRKLHPNGQVLVVSANEGVEIRVGAILVGARAVVPLPLPTPGALREKLGAALGRDR